MRRALLVLAALLGAVSVAMAAIGSHGGYPRVTLAAWIGLPHAVLVVAVALHAPRGWVMLAGASAILLGAYAFAASMVSLDAWTISLGPVAPVAGLMLMAGWLTLAFAGLRSR
ncbi:MAG: DUF423 domain-containing protein [Alphaproteobacteria bacterium]|nr:DUF423 domain-containing protein [Alphaproteobacteria bacterium]